MSLSKRTQSGLNSSLTAPVGYITDGMARLLRREWSLAKLRKQTWLQFIVPFVFPTSVYLATYLGNLWMALPLVLAYVILPLADILVGEDDFYPEEYKKHPGKNGKDATVDSPMYWLLPIIWAPVQLHCVYHGCMVYASGDLSWFEQLALLGSVSLIVSGGYAVSHELIHKHSVVEKAAAWGIMLSTGYMHFLVEHIHGHHKRVATPEDPASARFGESYWQFLPRYNGTFPFLFARAKGMTRRAANRTTVVFAFRHMTVIGSYKSAWGLELARLRRKGESVWSLQNQMIWFHILPVFVTLFVYAMGGYDAAVFFVVQCVVSTMFFEGINYIEHYGLEREKRPNGKYEPVNFNHSWNANTFVTNLVLLRLQRHSDHHMHPARRYQVLRHFDPAPQLPYGYSIMVLSAFIPWLWRRMMDHRVLAYRKWWSEEGCARVQRCLAEGNAQ